MLIGHGSFEIIEALKSKVRCSSRFLGKYEKGTLKWNAPLTTSSEWINVISTFATSPFLILPRLTSCRSTLFIYCSFAVFSSKFDSAVFYFSIFPDLPITLVSNVLFPVVTNIFEMITFSSLGNLNEASTGGPGLMNSW